MAWIELHQSLFTHRKTMAAADLLDIPEVYVVAHLAALWTWALDNAQDGVIEASPRVIARACQWPGQPATLIDGLTGAGFLTPDGEANRYVIHDWHDYAGRLVDRRQANAERMRRARAEKHTSTDPEQGQNVPVQSLPVQDTCTERAAHVQGLPNPTQPNPTVPAEQNTVTGTNPREASAPRQAASALGAHAPDPLKGVTGRDYPMAQTRAEVNRREFVAEVLVAHPDWVGRLNEELDHRDRSAGLGNEYAYAVPILHGWLDKGGPPPRPSSRQASPSRVAMTPTDRRVAEGTARIDEFIEEIRQGKVAPDGTPAIPARTASKETQKCLPPTKH